MLGSQAQILIHVQQADYQLSYLPSQPLIYLILKHFSVSVAQAGLELTILCLCLQGTVISGFCRHAEFVRVFLRMYIEVVSVGSLTALPVVLHLATELSELLGWEALGKRIAAIIQRRVLMG